MNSIKRNGVDIAMAFTSASRRMRIAAVVQPVAAAPADIAEAAVHSVGDVAGGARTRISTMLRHQIKRVLRRLARSAYRATKPFARPVLFRVRSYFTSALREEMQQQFARLQEHQQEQTRQIMQELQRLANAANVQTSLSRKLIAEQLPLEKAGPQLDRIEHYSLIDVNRVAINSGSDETLVKSAVGYVLCGAKDHALLANLMEAGELEPGTRKLIERLVRPGDTYIDVGANIGMHSIAAARAMAGRGKVIAFEPFEPTRKMLERNLWLNGFSEISEVSHYALSDTTGTHKLHLGATSGHHSLYELETPSFSSAASVDISTTTLDEFLPESQTARLLKLDAEGAEIDIVKGAKRLLSTNPHMFIIVELGLSHLKRNSIALEDWLRHFTALGLAFNVVNDQTGDLEDWSAERLSQAESVNLLFTSPESMQAARTQA
ncbi:MULTISPECIES: FkbM family methyltransferase [unclassified Pseudomonas]|uniref:FkbM family methyltransferase n=1 Tax=unclassified Pseudomonas TaxID=196821 RepID=UPI000A1ECB37|nr:MULTISPECIES: FkbM family methyltransferase [unclassified Pseudomonas]